MKRKVLALILALTMFSAMGITSFADGGATLSFTESNTLEYGGSAAVVDGEMSLGSAFAGVAPGQTKEQVITVKNDNNKTADFYISTEVLSALEESKATAKGAGYEVKLTAGGKVLYDSSLGGYKDGVASEAGMGDMNSTLKDYVLFATLEKGKTSDVILSITFDGEAMDSTTAVNYSNAVGKIAFDFQVGYEDPTGTEVIIREVSEDGQVTYVRKIVEILENGVPLGAVATGDGAMIGLAAVVLIAGAAMMILGRKKKAEEEA